MSNFANNGAQYADVSLVNETGAKAAVNKHLLFILFTALIMGAGTYLRMWGGLLFVLYIAACFLYAASNRFSFVKSLLVLTATGLLYIGASYADLLPDAWTRFYDKSAIVRQSIFVISLYPIFSAFLALWSHSLKSGSEVSYKKLLFFIVVPLFALSSYFQKAEVVFPSGHNEYLTVLWNAVAAALFCISALAIENPKGRAFKVILLCAVTILISSRFQLVLAMLGILFLSLLPRPRLQLLILVPASFALTFIFMPYAPEISLLDVNTGVRLFFWQDALAALVDTYGVGVGFGKEAIVNFYQNHTKDVVFSEDGSSAQNFMLIGTHNSFFGMFFRLGILGGLAFLVFFVRYCFPRKVPCETSQRKMCIAFYLAFLCCFVNVAIESPLFQIGVLCLLGYVAANNRYFSEQKQTLISTGASAVHAA